MTNDTPLKRCSQKELCVHAEQVNGGWLPATTVYFHTRNKSPDKLAYLCRACKKAAAKADREAHPEKDRERSKRYRENNPEHFRVYAEEHAEEIAATKRKWREEHPEEVKKQKRESEKRNRPSANARLKRYNERNPLRRDARTALTNAVRLGKMPRVSTLKCALCGAQADEYHHHNGYEPDHWLDVIPLCIACHSKTRKPDGDAS